MGPVAFGGRVGIPRHLNNIRNLASFCRLVPQIRCNGQLLRIFLKQIFNPNRKVISRQIVERRQQLEFTKKVSDYRGMSSKQIFWFFWSNWIPLQRTKSIFLTERFQKIHDMVKKVG